MAETALERVRRAYTRIAETDRPEIWIDLRPQAEVEAEAAAVDARVTGGEHLPLAGRLLAVKGNIDVAGLPTTAGCPSYAYRPDADAPAVARLREAGAIVLGTTNLDQFATGLVGTRSPYGAVRAATDPDRISGGSSSGSAVAVALGLADLALGTDTAGSGRVPAAFNGIVGLKPTRGLIPTEGVVPACRSLDCVSVFARTLPEAQRALALMTGTSASPVSRPARRPGPWRLAVPATAGLGPLAPGWAEAFETTARSLASAGVEIHPIDPAPFLEAAALLYQGAFVAERYTAVGAFVEASAGRGGPDLDPTVASIITAARDLPAHRLFADRERLAALRERALSLLGDRDALLLPVTPRHPTLAEVAADPVGVNSDLGRFTNFVNLFDMCALAVPAGQVDGLPYGVMLVGRTHADDDLVAVARLLQPAVRLAVVGAHLSGQPLNHELTTRGARLLATTTTATRYRLHALTTDPPKPGLVRVPENGAAIECEVWGLPAAGLGDLLTALPRPMTLGQVELADGTNVPGFLCAPEGLRGAADITMYGGWRAYVRTLAVHG
ncbi:allophanate hydrolase [Microbispora sp. KK1-11]|uniref:allophanate hydrolase n=1 Tax=Microbispora sp. KK1-11 TaxID=2053005 RepID=UPI001159B9CE|nr:allophanate hydrolase [Microbispora sp. KK1-11]TQS28273.1 allophanate hydrolase [Microbispora sp. KK1-11]